MKIKIISSLIFFLSFLNCYSQEREIIDSTYSPLSKWPFLGPEIPKHIGVSFGFEGFDNHTLTYGIYHNIINFTSYGDFSKFGGFVGYMIYYKQFLNKPQYYALEMDLGIFSFISMGINLNYTSLENNSLFGVKPFLGLSLFQIDFLYGYSFYNKKKDTDQIITPHRLTARIRTPIIKLTKKKEVKHYIYTYPDY